jgi:hypothetical protein
LKRVLVRRLFIQCVLVLFSLHILCVHRGCDGSTITPHALNIPVLCAQSSDCGKFYRVDVTIRGEWFFWRVLYQPHFSGLRYRCRTE